MQLEIHNLSKQYTQRAQVNGFFLHKKEKKALSGLNMTFEEGIYGLLGPNGAGKSTLMNILVGNLSQSEGIVTYDGEDIRKMGKKYRRLLGYMPQQQTIYPFFTGWEFLSYMAVLKEVPKKVIKNRVEWAARQVNLQDELSKKLHAYSGGMKQRILLAGAILNNPEILILDEPTAGLDPRERIRIRNLISALSSNKIVIIATHVVSDVEYISKEIVLLSQGDMLRKGRISQLTDEVRSYVYELETDEEDISKIEEQYRVSNIFSDGHKAKIRVITEKKPEHYPCVYAMPTLEDVYLYHFF